MRTRRTFPAWLAILAMALQGLWPLLAQARPAQAKLLLPVCTVDGTVHYVELAAGKPADSRKSQAHEHCQLCVAGSAKLVAPPVVAAPLARLEPASAEHFTAAAPQGAAAPPYPPAHPRAPPVLS